MDTRSKLAHFFKNLFELSQRNPIFPAELLDDHFPAKVSGLADFDVPEDAIADQGRIYAVSRLQCIVTMLAKNWTNGVGEFQKTAFLPVGVGTAQDSIVKFGVDFKISHLYLELGQ